jgi:hypothetical protein
MPLDNGKQAHQEDFIGQGTGRQQGDGKAQPSPGSNGIIFLGPAHRDTPARQPDALLVLAGEWHEGNGQDLPRCHFALFILLHQKQLLNQECTSHRNHHTTTRF